MKPITSMIHFESRKRVTKKCLHWGLAALVLVCSTSASAQIFGTKFGPDVAVAPSIMPASMSAYQPRALSYAVTNNGPLYAHSGTGSNTVKLHVDLTGLMPFNASPGVAGGSCVFATVNGVTGYSTVDCTATVSWGSTIYVDVYVVPASTSNPTSATCTDSFHCGQPTYADAFVSSTGIDPTSTNNRLLTRIDITGC